MPRNRRTRQDGNVFVYVLLGIVLFAALMFTFTRSARQGGDNMSTQQVGLAVSDMMDYAQRIDHAVSRILARDGMSESYLSFQNALSVANYTNLACNGLANPTLCKVFDAAGGGAAWQKAPDKISASEWLLTGTNAVPNVGGDTNADLLLILQGISASACIAINDALGVANPGGDPPQDSDDIDTTLFTGSFANTARISAVADGINGDNAACIMNSFAAPTTYLFYAVLMAR